MFLEKGPFQKETSLPTMIFAGAMIVFGVSNSIKSAGSGECMIFHGCILYFVDYSNLGLGKKNLLSMFIIHRDTLITRF